VLATLVGKYPHRLRGEIVGGIRDIFFTSVSSVFILLKFPAFMRQALLIVFSPLTADTREDYMAWLEDKTEKLNIKHTER
tara:strand:- start:1010 stop:1249 length:240 start_codon:yes stop_codon:yes gene_type:complete